MKEVMKGVDIVYHCAATAHEGLSVFSPYEISKNNFLASVSVFSAAVSHKVKRIIFCSSMARYGNQNTPFTEDMNPKPVDPYGIAKVAAEKILTNLGVKTVTTKDSIKIYGNPNLNINLNKKIIIKNYMKDHRVFMTSLIAALSFGGKWIIHDKDSINLSLIHI